jgi:hypothetical protein
MYHRRTMPGIMVASAVAMALSAEAARAAAVRAAPRARADLAVRGPNGDERFRLAQAKRLRRWERNRRVARLP